jgi:hypothetical protein
MRGDTEAAGQVALGFEWRFAPGCAFAMDAERTQMYGGVTPVPASRIHAAFAALRAEF